MSARGVLWILILMGVTLSGCIQTDDGPSVPEIETPPEPITQWVFDAAGAALNASDFGAELPVFELLRSSDRISGEPTLGITRDGVVFYAAIDFDAVGGLPRTEYVASDDGGLTWEDRSPAIAGVDTHPTSFDPYVYVDPTTGRVYAMDMGPHVLCNKVSWSDDNGATWVTREGACVPMANDHPTLFAGPATVTTNVAAYPNQLYLCTNQLYDTMCYQSNDGGLNWFVTEPAFLQCGGLTGHGHVSWADGTVYLGRDWCGQPTAGVSHDGGLTWSQVVISENEVHDPRDHDVSIGTDSAGNAYAFWVADEGRGVFYSTSRDMGRSWSDPINVTAPGVTAAKLPSLVAGAEGRVAFQYIGTANPHGHEIGKLKADCADRSDPECFEYADDYNESTWNAYVGYTLTGHTDAPVFATVMANHPDEPLKRGDCSGRCFGDQGGMYDFLDIDIDPMTGQIWTALVDVCSGDCDGPGKGKFDVHEKAVGTVAKLVAGPMMLDEPYMERSALV